MAGTVRLLLHGNGSNGSTTVTDSSNDVRVVTNGGSIVNSSTQSKFGGASLFFPDPADANCYLTTPYTSDLQIWSSDYTIESFIYPTSFANAGIYGILIGNMTYGTNYWSFGPNSSGSLVFYSFDMGFKVSSGTIALNEWSHIAFTKEGNTVRLFINGFKEHESTVNASYPDSTSIPLRVANYNDLYYKGYIDDLRITAGQALYTDTFSVPSSELEAVFIERMRRDIIVNNAASRINNCIRYQGL